MEHDDSDLNVATARNVLAAAERKAADLSNPFAAMLKSTADVTFASELAWAAGTLADRRAIPTLQQAVLTGPSEVRRAAAAALGQLGVVASTKLLIDLLFDDDSAAAEGAVEALALIGGTDAIEAFRAVLGDASKPDELRGLAAEYASILKGGDVLVSELQRLAEVPSASLRFWAAHSLGAIGSEDSVPGLVQLFDDSRVAWRGRTVGEEARQAVQLIELRSAGR